MGENKNDQVYQKIFELTLEWGDQWKDRVKDRAKQLHPDISTEEVDKIAQECWEIHRHSLELKKEQGKNRLTQKEFNTKIKLRYPQLDEKNTQKLFHYAQPKKADPRKKSEKNTNERHLKSTKSTISKIFRRFF